MVFIYLLSNTL